MKKGLLTKLFAFVLALALIVPQTGASFAKAEETQFTDIGKAASGVTDQVYNVKGVVTMVDGKNVYVQDATGAICLYFDEAPKGIALGDTITASGKFTMYGDVPELAQAKCEKSSGMTLEAKETTIDALSAKDISAYVKLTGLTITKIDDGDGKYSTPNIFCTDGKNEIELYKAVIEKNGNAWAYKVGDVITVMGAYTTYKGVKELRNTLASEITKYDAKSESILKEGNKVVIYSVGASGVLAATTGANTLNTVEAEIDGLKASSASGARVFTISKNGEFYRFLNETDGYLCANGTGSNAFYDKKASVDADWALIEGNGGYFFQSQSAKYKDTPQFLEYYNAVTTYSKKADSKEDIYTFKLFKTDDNVTKGIVNKPLVKIGTLPEANVGSAYKFSFKIDSYFGVDTVAAKLGSEKITVKENEGAYTISIPKKKVTGKSLKVIVTGKDKAGASFSGETTIAVSDKPVFTKEAPASKSETKNNRRPAISVNVSNAGKNPTVVMKVAGKKVKAAYKDGKITYKPAADLKKGLTNVTVKVTRKDKATATYSWSFTVGTAKEQLYFGQLHSHTAEYSDGAGTLEEGLKYIASLPKKANVDFVAFTDHSNYFDTTAEANPEGALYDMTLASEYSNTKWNSYKKAVADFNNSHSDVLAIAGFEMTWSGGPGHMNTFNTPGIVSRNNATLNAKTDDAGIQAYYNLLSRDEGKASMSMFNHPGTTFGTFADFSFWNETIDSRIYLLEVGNGEGQIGAGGYYPSYEYYTMALDKGWHVAPTNNQDNHKGKWGNANDARDVILTSDFSEEGIYNAIKARRIYATEDKNLEIKYTLNNKSLGSIIKKVPKKVNIDVTVKDPDKTDTISKVEVIVNSGKVAYSWDDAAVLAKGKFKVSLKPTYSYYYIRVTEGDGDIAVTAPVWVGDTLKLGISAVECATSTPVTGEEATINTTLFNSEKTAAKVKKIVYTANGSEVIKTDKKGYEVPSLGTLTIPMSFTPDKAKVTTVTAKVYVELGGVDYTYSMDVTLDVLDSTKLVYIGIDASHFNEYVAGNYKDSMGNFGTLAAGYSIRTKQLDTSKDLIAACSNKKYKALILTAPSRRLANGQEKPLDYIRNYSDEEIAAIVDFAKNGGTVILSGWADYYENYPEIKGNPVSHMAAEQNKLLEALGCSIRFSDDTACDDSLNGGDSNRRLYFSSYNFDSFLLDGVELDKDHPNDVMYTERYSNYGGCTLYLVDENGKETSSIPESVTPVVFGHKSTYSKDNDGDALGGKVATYKYAKGDNRTLALATEDKTWDNGKKSLIIVAGAAFMSNFEVQYTVGDSGSEKNYSNFKICENLSAYIHPMTITSIKKVRAQKETGVKYNIEGVVTSNASGYDKDTAFFDCIYVQDKTGGICCFPVAGEFKVGDKVRVTGTTDFYQGEPELQVTSITKLGTGKVKAATATAEQINKGKVTGSLVKVSGTVLSFEKQNGLVQTIWIKDKAGKKVRVFIDGYITASKDVKNLAAGKSITVTGLASYDNTFDTSKSYYARIRVRNRKDVVVK